MAPLFLCGYSLVHAHSLVVFVAIGACKLTNHTVKWNLQSGSSRSLVCCLLFMCPCSSCYVLGHSCAWNLFVGTSYTLCPFLLSFCRSCCRYLELLCRLPLCWLIGSLSSRQGWFPRLRFLFHLIMFLCTYRFCYRLGVFLV